MVKSDSTDIKQENSMVLLNNYSITNNGKEIPHHLSSFDSVYKMVKIERKDRLKFYLIFDVIMVCFTLILLMNNSYLMPVLLILNSVLNIYHLINLELGKLETMSEEGAMQLLIKFFARIIPLISSNGYSFTAMGRAVFQTMIDLLDISLNVLVIFLFVYSLLFIYFINNLEDEDDMINTQKANSKNKPKLE